jgi:hypothetical protein
VKLIRSLRVLGPDSTAGFATDFGIVSKVYSYIDSLWIEPWILTRIRRWVFMVSHTLSINLLMFHYRFILELNVIECKNKKGKK